jgi:uncharacterized protein (UPF0262 family)
MTTADTQRLSDVVLDETIGRATPDVEHERAVAIFDLIEENSFEPVGHDTGPYKLKLSLIDSKLVFSISSQTDERSPPISCRLRRSGGSSRTTS